MHRRGRRHSRSKEFPYRVGGGALVLTFIAISIFILSGSSSANEAPDKSAHRDVRRHADETNSLSRHTVPGHGGARDEVVVTLVSCGDKMAKDLQLLVKSILHNFDPTSRDIRIILFTDKGAKLGRKDPRLIETIETIPYASIDEYDVHDVGISESHLNLFRTCAGARLAFPNLDVLKQFDKILYLDTDTLVLEDIGHLWSFFDDFNSTQHSGMTQQATRIHKYGWYMSPAGAQSVCKKDDPPVCVPFYGMTGLNSGIYLMHLQRMRSLKPKSLHSELMEIVNGPAKANVHRFQLGDQDVLNYYFAYHPDQLYEIPCQWNFRTDSYCDVRPGVLHGNRGAFHWNEHNPTIYTVTWRMYEYVDYKSLIDPRWIEYPEPGDR